eukprot:c10331_g1_i1.p1 GENE.c10331_g1_i1~~c10331_g1_i1.p1  ORF type:complete len:176 (-),score=11.85 c10331_g1_i1:21-548(-)
MGIQHRKETMSQSQESATALASLEQNLNKAAQLISQAKRVVCFTGAGMSAESGISTFRGKGGAWSGLIGKITLVYGATPLGWNWTPRFVWRRFVIDFLTPITDARPNKGHFAITRLQHKFTPKYLCVTTMNVDGLHQDAGTETVFEVHGTVRKYKCGKCSARIDVPTPIPVQLPS